MRALRLHYLAPLGLWLAAVALISLAEGTPDPPPAVALGSTALLHASLARPGREALDALDQES